MADNETTDVVETAAETPMKKKASSKDKPKDKAKPKIKSKAKTERSKAEKPAAVPQFDFVGKVESLVVRSGSGAEGFEFGLKGRHGKRQTFRLDSADAFALNAMAHLVLAAHASETRIGVRTTASADGVLTVRELASRPGLRRGD